MGVERNLNVLVTGATGQQGGAVARSLLDAGHRVRALTRSPATFSARRLGWEGAEIAVGDFDDATSLGRAMHGVDALFAMGTPFERGPGAEIRQACALIDAAVESGVRHVVYSSAANAHDNTGVPHFDSKVFVERYLRSTNLPHTIVAPVFFMENLRAPSVLPHLRFGKLALPVPRNRPLQMIALADLADFVVLVMESRTPFLGQRVELASDEIRGWRGAQILTNVMGRRVDYVETPPSSPQWANPDVARMLQWLARSRHSVDVAALHERYDEIGWRTFSDWALMHDWRPVEPAHEIRPSPSRASSLRLVASPPQSTLPVPRR
jgi:uncharacterized protein YbjT (DUF2867 family)